MRATDNEVTFVFVVDTDHYAGNFEREMTAYCTGQVGVCSKGQSEAEEFEEDRAEGFHTEDFSAIIRQRPDDNGNLRPASIWPTPGRVNDGNGRHSDGEMGPGTWPAYESVAMFFSERPSPEALDLIKARAGTFAERHAHRRFGSGKPILIKGFRLLRQDVAAGIREEPLPW